METSRVKTCRYAFAHLITWICTKSKYGHKIIPDYDCENCKDYSNKYYMTKEKTMEDRNGNKGTED